MKSLVLRTVALALATTGLGGCASILSGTTQEVYVNTNPPAASCKLTREGKQIGSVNPTPAAAKIEKTKKDITITCNKDGYQTATYIDHSGTAGAFWGNVIAGGVIGMGVDSATGADNKYESPVNITLVPQPSPPAPVPAQPQTPPPATPPVPSATAPNS